MLLLARKSAFVIMCMGYVCGLYAQVDTLHNTHTQAANSLAHSHDSALHQTFNLHFQFTYIYQYKPAFHSPYAGSHSLPGTEEKQNSLTSTLYIGLRLWKGAEAYINPEIAGGSGLSGAYGLAASTNGETYRVGNPAPTLYLARAYVKQTIAFSHSYSTIDDGANQLACQMPKDYIQFMIGKYCLGDVFDGNTYSDAPRTQFMNWAIMNNAAWDYASNVRGYNYALTTILQLHRITYKTSLSLLPFIPNGAILNTHINQAFAINTEVDKAYTLHNRAGNIRLLGYCNYGGFGSYTQALNSKDSIPNIANTRQAGRYKIGFGINVDEQLSKTLGAFARAGWNNGQTETWCYTESDKTLSAGLTINGKKWMRPNDIIGLGYVMDALSQQHKDYLAAGGLGFELGDGRLNYGKESACEIYYSLKPVSSSIWLSADYQYVINPGYNKDRGPVNVFSLRAHIEL